MQTRGEGDDTDACDKHRPPPWSFSVCIFSCPRHTYPTTWAGKVLIDSGCHPILILWLCVKIRIDTRCFVYFPWTRAGKNRNASHTAAQLPRTWASQKPDHCFMSPYWARGRLIATSPRSPVRMISPRKRGKAAQNKDHKRCCESHPHQPAERNPYSFSISTF